MYLKVSVTTPLLRRPSQMDSTVTVPSEAQSLRPRPMKPLSPSRDVLFREYLVSGSVPATVYGLADLIECSPDARGSVFQDRFDSLQAQVMQLGDSKLERFLAEVKKANRSILGEVEEHE